MLETTLAGKRCNSSYDSQKEKEDQCVLDAERIFSLDQYSKYHQH